MEQFIDIKKLKASIEKLVAVGGALGVSGFPATQAALYESGAYIMQTWTDFVSGKPIPGESRKIDSAEYRSSLRMTTAGLGVAVFTESPEASRIEDGTPAVDLKTRLPFKNSRVSKDGSYYSAIPFRHDVEKVKAMPGGNQIYNRMKGLSKSFVVGSYMETQQRGGDSLRIVRMAYKWGSRLTNVKNSAKHLEGMVRMQSASGKNESRSTYLTFRTISTKSKDGSWILPEKPALDLSGIVARYTEEQVLDFVSKGLDRDLEIINA